MNDQAIGKGVGQKATAAIDVAREKEPSTGAGEDHGQHYPSLDRKVFYRVVFLVFYLPCTSMALVAVLDPPPFSIVVFLLTFSCFAFTTQGSIAKSPVLPWAKKHGATFALKDYQALLKKIGLIFLSMIELLILAFPLIFLSCIMLSGIDGAGAGIALCHAIYYAFFYLLLF